MPDLNDVLRLARSEGAKLFRVDPVKVRVKPFCQPFESGYVVVVDADGCKEASVVVGGRIQEKAK